ncbi:MAG: hypothetical protein CMK07_13015 [Ponticaulis sp.]|nr:hypothetical protein [Ponticaulis sp.]
MTTRTRRLTQLGLGAAFAGTTFLTACGGQPENPEPQATTPPAAAETSATPMPAEEPAEAAVAPSGEGEGEGGVLIDQAGTNPVVFRSALAITEAHIVAARDAYKVGETDAAAEMFAHPVSEVLFDVGPYLEARGVENFDQMLLDASEAVFQGETTEQIDARTDEIIATLRSAAEKAPDDGSSEALIQAGVAADQLDRAATMYGIAGESDEYEPYLDGYGFVIAGKAAFEAEKTAIEAELPDVAAALETALTQLEMAYPTVERPEALDHNPAALTGSVSALLLALGQ